MPPVPVTPTRDETSGPVAAEPVALVLSLLFGVFIAALTAADALDWIALTGEQTTAIVAFVTATLAAAGAIIRAKVWSPASVADLVERQTP